MYCLQKSLVLQKAVTHTDSLKLNDSHFAGRAVGESWKDDESSLTKPQQRIILCITRKVFSAIKTPKVKYSPSGILPLNPPQTNHS